MIDIVNDYKIYYYVIAVIFFTNISLLIDNDFYYYATCFALITSVNIINAFLFKDYE